MVLESLIAARAPCVNMAKKKKKCEEKYFSKKKKKERKKGKDIQIHN